MIINKHKLNIERTDNGDGEKMEFKNSKTVENLKAGFAGESQANRRYLYFALKADEEGFQEIAQVFRSTADGETAHAFGHLKYLATVGDPVTGEPIGSTEQNLKSAIAGETYEYSQMYPGFAKAARTEGYEDIAHWFEVLSKAEKSHATKYEKTLAQLKQQ